ncbi:hypothetical protein G7Y89_g12141 [Cudoniella acicularis]|uniref:Uncharacterized protein n=1 Tax=Cudoniella acicularis TaxID=354080 RepID=A0A8H4RBZ2_9HELO|nr:hypothetical protein G7Y89_g12141 [Cudoniella acicularis]
MAQEFVIQILEKEHYFTQHHIPLVVTQPSVTLDASCIRIQSKVLSLTANNISYAKLGFLFNWWDVYPLPPSTPSPFNDASRYGRICAWGFAEVVASTHDTVAVGSYIWGYLPTGTLPETLEVEKASGGHVAAINQHRRGLSAGYNRYKVYPASLKTAIEAREDSIAYDSLVRAMFSTGYLLNRFVFSQDQISPHMESSTSRTWSSEAADLSNALIFCLAPGSKTAMCFAHELRVTRAESTRLAHVVAVSSDLSIQFVKDSGEYSTVVSTSSDPMEVLKCIGGGHSTQSKVVLFDFGGRPGLAEKWASAISNIYEKFVLVKVGSGISETPSSDILAILARGERPSYETIQVNASVVRERVIAKIGSNIYFEGFEKDWATFKDSGCIKGLELTWGNGMKDLEKGWTALCSGKVEPSKGLVYSL